MKEKRNRQRLLLKTPVVSHTHTWFDFTWYQVQFSLLYSFSFVSITWSFHWLSTPMSDEDVWFHCLFSLILVGKTVWLVTYSAMIECVANFLRILDTLVSTLNRGTILTHIHSEIRNQKSTILPNSLSFSSTSSDWNCIVDFCFLLFWSIVAVGDSMHVSILLQPWNVIIF